MKVYFSHGKESGPWGSKIMALAGIAETLGWTVESIDYQDLADPDLRTERLVGLVQDQQELFVLAGSSMGGYVAVAACESLVPAGLFLMAPALYLPDYKLQHYLQRNRPHNQQSSHCADAHIEVVHGWSDDVVPPENSIPFAREANCALHLIPGDHRLNESMDAVGILFRQFLTSIKSRQYQ